MAQHIEIWGTSDPNISGQLALAAQLDLFKREAGLDVTCVFLESGTTMPYDILKASHKPFAFTQTPITAMLLREKGFPAKVVAPLADIAGTQQMILHPGCQIRHPKEFEGKRIGIAREAAIYMAINNMARDYNLDLQRVTFLDLLPNEQLAAFADGSVDAIASWEPWTTKLRKMGGQFYFSGARSEIPGMEGDVSWLVDQGCLMVPDEHLAARADEILAILGVLQKATRLLNEQRREVAQELSVFFDVQPQELIAAMRKNLYSMRFDNLFRIGILGFRDFLYREGRIASRFPEQALYDTSFLQQIAPDLVAFEETIPQDVSVIERHQVYYRKDVTIVGDGRDVRFLVVDDSKIVRSALTQTIDILGGEVLGEATTGHEAIEMFTRLRPNFITMDLSMPEMSGLDAIKRIRQLDPKVNIIVISGLEHKELREEVFDLGVKIFIVKPFDPLQVAEIIGLLLL